MSISTLVLIVLAIIVLVLVVIGFTGGWSNLWDRITNLGGSKENVQLAADACKIACSSNAQYDYCGKLRDINFGTDQKERNGNYNCKALETENVGLPVCEAFTGVNSCVAQTPNTQRETSVVCSDVGPAYTTRVGSTSTYMEVGTCKKSSTTDSAQYVEISNGNIENYLEDNDYTPDSVKYVLAPAAGSDVDKVCCLVIPAP